MSDTPSLNPYQPAAPIAPTADQDSGVGEFRVSAKQLRYAESQYLLHWRGARLFTGSLTLIILSAIVFVLAIFRGGLAFVIAVVVSVSISTFVYTALIRRDSHQIRQNQRRLGLIDGSSIGIEMVSQELVLHTQNGQFHWPHQAMRSYRTRKGILISPEPLVVLFVPKGGTPEAIYESLYRKTFGESQRRFL